MRICYTDEELMAGLRTKKSSCISYLYEEYAPALRNLVRNNSGNLQDTEDLFQDALMVLFDRSREDAFRLKCSLKTYFIAVARKLWYQRLDRKYRLLYKADYEAEAVDGNRLLEEEELAEQKFEQQRLFYKYFLMLPDECRKLLQLYCLKTPYREIAKLMRYKDAVYVKTRKYSCKQMLRNKILKDPQCHLIFEYEKNRNAIRFD